MTFESSGPDCVLYGCPDCGHTFGSNQALKEHACDPPPFHYEPPERSESEPRTEPHEAKRSPSEELLHRLVVALGLLLIGAISVAGVLAIGAAVVSIAFYVMQTIGWWL